MCKNMRENVGDWWEDPLVTVENPWSDRKKSKSKQKSSKKKRSLGFLSQKDLKKRSKS